jgi:hypothetical protein
MNTRPFVLSFLLLGLAVAPPGVGLQRPQANSGRVASPGQVDRVITRWFEQLDEAHQDLLAAEWKKAWRRLDRLDREIAGRFVDGPEAPRLLGQLSLLRALAEAGRGERANAAWEYSVACSFLPALATLDMSRYGVAGEVLAAERARWEPPRNGEDGNGKDVPVDEATLPRKIESPVPVFPWPHQVLCTSGLVAVKAFINTTGIPTRPKVVTQVHPMLAFAALRTLREWRFAPAELNGRPVAVWYNLSVNFRFRGRCAPQ